MPKVEDINTMYLVMWRHPTLGGIAETLCPAHKSEVLRAFQMFGMEWDGRPMSPDNRRLCTRCHHVGEAPQSWLDSARSER
jgi:hypothetical protein